MENKEMVQKNLGTASILVKARFYHLLENMVSVRDWKAPPFRKYSANATTYCRNSEVFKSRKQLE